jgi:HSP20 family molecular chaperone IbpA
MRGPDSARAPTSIRAGHLGAFAAVDIGTADDTIEIVEFAPGIHPTELEVSIDKGLLTISERAPARRDGLRAYTQERFFSVIQACPNCGRLGPPPQGRRTLQQRLPGGQRRQA